MNILIVKLSAFGDIIHTLPALDDLRRRGANIHWLVDARFSFVTELFPPDVRVHIVALKGEQRLRHAWRSIQSLRSLHFDAVLDLQGLIKSGLMARFGSNGAPVHGFDRRESPEWPNHWLLNAVPFHPDERHVVQKYRHIAAAPFINDATCIPDQAMAYTPPTIQHTAKQQQAAQAILNLWQGKKHTILHMGGGWQTKRLEIPQWRQCVAALIAKDVSITLCWGSEKERHRALSVADYYESVYVLPERLNIHAMAGMLHAAQAVIGMDTGIVHLAAALGTPTVTLWGPSASWNAGAKGQHDTHVESNPSCGPCFKRSCSRFICLPGVNPLEIVAAWERVRR